MIRATLLSVLLLSQEAKAGTSPLRPPAGDTLQPFEAVLESGDEDWGIDAFRVTWSAGGYFAELVEPLFFVGDRAEEDWKVELDKSAIAACKAFLRKARSLQGHCPDDCCDHFELTVSMPGDTLRVHGNCDWHGKGFFDLRNAIFKAQFTALVKARIHLKDSLSTMLAGTWYLAGREQLNKDVLIKLTRSVPALEDTCQWTFSPPDPSTNASDAEDEWDPEWSAQNHSWDVDGGSILLTITASVVSPHCEGSHWGYDATFKLHSLAPDTLQLNTMWMR